MESHSKLSLLLHDRNNIHTFEQEHGAQEKLKKLLKKSNEDLFHLLAEIVYVQSSLSIDTMIHRIDHKFPGGADLHQCCDLFKMMKIYVPIELLAAVHEHLDTEDRGKINIVTLMQQLQKFITDLCNKRHDDVDHSSLEEARKISKEANLRRSQVKITTAASRKNFFGQDTKKIPGDEGEDQQLIAVVAHNDMKPTMMSFVTEYIDFFKNRRVVTTNSTGKSLEQALGINVFHKVASGPLGGDQEIGALVAQDKVAAVFFFRDPLSAHPHDSDIHALCRLCDVHKTLFATNRATGQALIHSLCNLDCHTALLVPHQEHHESEVIKAYKSKQSQTIASVAAKVNQNVDRSSL